MKGIISALFFVGIFICSLLNTTMSSSIAIAKPCFPYTVGSFNTRVSATGVYVSDTTVYVADQNGGLQMINVTDPASPKILGVYDTDNANGVYVSGTTAYLADLSSGLQIVDVTDPTSPKFLGSYYNTYANGVYVTNTTAYLAAGGNGLQIIDNRCCRPCISKIHRRFY